MDRYVEGKGQVGGERTGRRERSQKKRRREGCRKRDRMQGREERVKTTRHGAAAGSKGEEGVGSKGGKQEWKIAGGQQWALAAVQYIGKKLNGCSLYEKGNAPSLPSRPCLVGAAEPEGADPVLCVPVCGHGWEN